MLPMMFASLCGYLAKGLTGFANTLVFDAILSFWEDNIHITPVDLPLSLLSNIIIAYHERRHVSFKVCGRAALYMVIGIIPGVFFLKIGDPAHIKIILGLLIIAMGLNMLREAYQQKKSVMPKAAAAVLGIMSGFFSGLLGIGAMISVYIAQATDNMEDFKGNLTTLFIATNAFRFIIYMRMGILNTHTLTQSAMLLPCMGLGLWGGMRLSNIISPKAARYIMIIFLIISGVSLTVMNL
jgi:uncharacterized membrane protein YfcA